MPRIHAESLALKWREREKPLIKRDEDFTDYNSRRVPG